MVALGCIYMNMSIEEVITALTINGAAAVDRADKVGSIEPGKAADIIFLKFPSIHYAVSHRYQSGGDGHQEWRYCLS